MVTSSMRCSLLLLLLLVAAFGRRQISTESDSSGLPGRGQLCSPECLSQLPPWKATCCAKGLACHARSRTCEIEIGEVCYTVPKKKGVFKRLFGRKKKQEKESKKCAVYYSKHHVACRLMDESDESAHCCVMSYDIPNVLHQAPWEKFAKDTSPLKTSPRAEGKAGAFTPPDGTSRTCCEKVAYEWPDGEQACVRPTKTNFEVAAFQGLRFLKP